MKVLDMNPFIQACSHIFQQFQFTCSIGEPKQASSSTTGKDIITVIGVTGDLRGQIYLAIPKTTALSIASTMMGGVELSEIDFMVQSAISELSNMICGNAVTLFSKEGIVMDITPPTLIYGNQIEVSAGRMQVMSIPLQIEGMEAVEINIALE